MLNASLTVSYSGIRGIVGESLTAASAEQFGRAFGRLLQRRHPHATILMARDSRPSGVWIADSLLAGLSPYAERLLELGVVATPTLQFYLGPSGAHAGVVVTASHNPAQWNGFKFFLGPENTVLDAQQTADLLALTRDAATDPSPAAEHQPPARQDMHEEAVRQHVERVLAQVDGERIRRRHFRVAVDSAQGAGGEALQQLLHQLECETFVVTAARDSEPLPENLVELCHTVVQHHCDLGLAQDMDADRLALVDEHGQPVGEEFTLVLAAEHLLRRGSQKPVVVVKNISTTRALDDVVARYGARLVETRVGEVNLSRALHREAEAGNFVFGGEGNGGVIFPPVSLGRDSLVGTAIILEALATANHSISTAVSALPHYHSRKAKQPRPDTNLSSIFARVETAFTEGAADRLDGLRVRFVDGSWLSLRPSNTEPILRLTVESPSAQFADAAMQRLRALL